MRNQATNTAKSSRPMKPNYDRLEMNDSESVKITKNLH